MRLHFIWHIFRKDVRRQWWMIVLTLLLLARLAHFDSWRSDATPGYEEGWLYILLPLAWSVLAALAVLDDPVVAESPFWMTVPCDWRSVLAAKVVFVITLIHFPYLIGCAVVMQARGFAPLEYPDALLEKQIVLLVVTLTSLAVATLVRNLTQFLMIAIALATVAGAPSLPLRLGETSAVHHVKEVVVFSVITLAALWIAFRQYGRHSVDAARAAGVISIAIAAIAWWFPTKPSTQIPANAISTPLKLQQSGSDEPHPGLTNYRPDGTVQLAIPLIVEGLKPGVSIDLRLLRPNLEATDGRSYGTTQAYSYFTPDEPTIWEMIQVRTYDFKAIGDSPVTVRGKAFENFYRQSRITWTTVDKSLVPTPFATCQTPIVGDNPDNQNVKVICESPRSLPNVQVWLLDPAKRRQWSGSLQQSVSLDYPTATWLSPVNRKQTYFAAIDEEHLDPRSFVWQIPRAILPSLKIAIASRSPEGGSAIDYNLPDIKLSQYQVIP